jgi:hypothetical protein
VVGIGQRQAVAGAGRAIGEEAVVLRPAQCGFGHVADRLAGIHALDERDLLGARLDGIGDGVQDGAALGPGDRAPRRERRGGSLGGGVDIRGVAGGDLGQHRVVGGAERLEGPARPAGNRLSGNEVTHGRVLELGQRPLGLVEVRRQAGALAVCHGALAVCHGVFPSRS